MRGVDGQPQASAARGVSHVTVHRHVLCLVTMLVTVFRSLLLELSYQHRRLITLQLLLFVRSLFVSLPPYSPL